MPALHSQTMVCASHWNSHQLLKPSRSNRFFNSNTKGLEQDVFVKCSVVTRLCVSSNLDNNCQYICGPVDSLWYLDSSKVFTVGCLVMDGLEMPRCEWEPCLNLFLSLSLRLCARCHNSWTMEQNDMGPFEQQLIWGCYLQLPPPLCVHYPRGNWEI